MKDHQYRDWAVHLLTGALDIIFPPLPEEQLLREVKPVEFLSHYHPMSTTTFSCLARYTDPLIKAAITQNKFHASRRAAKLLAGLLEKWRDTINRPMLFIPVPLGKKRQYTRGHNQIETIIRRMLPRPPIDTTLLKRSIETKPQSELSRADRITNVQRAFTYTGRQISYPEGTVFVLVDDVVTTGATLAAARAALAPHLPSGTKLICLAIAH